MSKWYFVPFSTNWGCNAAAGLGPLRRLERQKAATLAHDRIQQSAPPKTDLNMHVRDVVQAADVGGEKTRVS
jgi:hypothetical protein